MPGMPAAHPSMALRQTSWQGSWAWLRSGWHLGKTHMQRSFLAKGEQFASRVGRTEFRSLCPAPDWATKVELYGRTSEHLG